MKHIIRIFLNIGLSAIIALAIFYAAYNYIPLDWLEGKFNLLGTSLTTINAGDTLRDSRTTINDNFTALNNGKIEVATTTLLQLTTATNLSSIGTITTGTWNAEILTVSYGGTGSSTLSSNKLLLGNGTGALKTIADGTAGQLLTASSTGNPPYWSTPSVDLAADYAWTGVHNNTSFNSASSTFTGKFEANRTITAIIDVAIDGSATPQLVAFHTTHGYVVEAQASSASTTRAFGFVTTNATASTSPNITTSGVVGGFSGLTPSAQYYLSDTAGEISTTQGTRIIPVGRAISTTQLLLNWGVKKYIATLSVTGGTADDAQGTVSTSTSYIGFSPLSVRLLIKSYCAGTNTTNDYWDATSRGKSTTFQYTGMLNYAAATAESRTTTFGTGSAFACSNPGSTNSGVHTLNVYSIDDEKILFNNTYTTKANGGINGTWTVYAEITGY